MQKPELKPIHFRMRKPEQMLELKTIHFQRKMRKPGQTLERMSSLGLTSKWLGSTSRRLGQRMQKQQRSLTRQRISFFRFRDFDYFSGECPLISLKLKKHQILEVVTLPLIWVMVKATAGPQIHFHRTAVVKQQPIRP
jgi:hypothetical protein